MIGFAHIDILYHYRADLALLMFPALIPAEEKSSAMRTADLVVVGKLELSSYYISFDGIHVGGRIVPTEILYGLGSPQGKLRYSELIECSLLNTVVGRVPGCDYRYIWSSWSDSRKRLTQTAVWILHRSADGSWTGRGGSDAGFRPLDYRDEAVRILSELKRHDPPH
jgi:hypothetical protein